MYTSIGITEDEEAEARLRLREREVKVAEKALFWDRIQAIALGVIPILTFFGFEWSRRRDD